jgi:hypothetical protein
MTGRDFVEPKGRLRQARQSLALPETYTNIRFTENISNGGPASLSN